MTSLFHTALTCFKKATLSMICCLSLIISSWSQAADNTALKLLRITPKGEDVAATQQIVFQFDRPMVAIGQMERDSQDIPVTIQPQLNCEWRWLNSSALACQLRAEDNMKQATHYQVVMQPGLQALDGAQLAQPISHEFTTRRPRATYTEFANWLTPGTPLLQVTFNQPVTRQSLEQAMVMVTNDQQGSATGVIATPNTAPRGEHWWNTIHHVIALKVQDLLTELDVNAARRVWLVRPQQELPLDTSITLQLKAGLASIEGDEVGEAQNNIVRFDTYPEFEFIGIRCQTISSNRFETLYLSQLQPDNPSAQQCNPLGYVALEFSAPVPDSMVKDHITFSPALDGGLKDYNPWANSQDYSQLTYPHSQGRTYYVWLPERLKAYQAYTMEFDLNGLKDEFQRTLNDAASQSQSATPNTQKLAFHTSHRPPKLAVRYDHAVLEKGVDSDIPLYVTNLDKVLISYDKLTTGQPKGKTELKHSIPVAPVEDIAYALPMGTRKLLDDQSGMLYGYVTASPEPMDWYEDEIFAQVTPYQVHFKAGHFNSMAWVTRFDNGKPVANANVSLWRGSYHNLTQLSPLQQTATTDANGIAVLPGLSEFDPELNLLSDGYYGKDGKLFVKVEKAQDMAVLPVDYNFASDYNYYDQQPKGGHTYAWGTTAQGVYKVGDTIQYKIYVRDQSNEHWTAPAQQHYQLQIIDPQYKVVYENKDIQLNAFGAFDGEFAIAKQAAVGWYQFNLKPVVQDEEKQTSHLEWAPMSVLVSDFTPSPFKVTTELNGQLFSPGQQAEITTLATLHSGGPFADAEVRLTGKLNEKRFKSNHPNASGFTFDSSAEDSYNTQTDLLDRRNTLNDKGEFDDTFTLPDSDIYYGNIMIEAAVKDERGKYVAAVGRANYAGRDRFVGLRNNQWLYHKGQTESIDALVVDAQGNPVSDVDIKIDIQHQVYKAARVKGPGNAYLTENIVSWDKEASCQIQSTEQAQACQFTPQHPGYYKFIARIKDTQNRLHTTTLYGWSVGQGSVVWDQSNDATLQIVPEQNEFAVGDTARYLIKNPFPGAQALVTVERYGVLDSWVQTLEGSTPVIEVPIKADYLPGFHFSVVVVSPRVAQPLGPNNVDLGKPSYRMGYVSATVSNPEQQLDVAVSTELSVYKPRDQVTAKIKVQADELQTDSHQANIEIAIAVVDESVLALNREGEGYYDPYQGFNHLDELDVSNYSLMNRLVGRQKFEKKGANPGGDGNGGGANPAMRGQFKYVSYWNPSVIPDANGEAEVTFDLPDNLTGWRILAMAVTPEDRMGLGATSIKVNRPTEVRPIMPNQITEGDQFQAGFSIMNRTDKPRELKVHIQASGPLADDSNPEFTTSIQVAPYKRQSVWMPIHTKALAKDEPAALQFTIRAADASDGDALQHQVPVHKRRSLETAATYGTLLEQDHISEAVQIPQGIYTDHGHIDTVLSASVIGNLEGAFQYIRNYPYYAWEPRLSKALAARGYIDLKDTLAANSDTQWDNPQDVILATLESAANFQAPNGGMAYWIGSNNFVSPYLSAYTAFAFNRLRQSGYEIPKGVEDALHGYLLKLLRSDAFPSFYSEGMASSVRAVALAALSEAGKTTADDIARYQPHMKEMDLFGKANFLQAALHTPNTSPVVVNQTLDNILGHASQTGGKFQFNEIWEDSYSYVLSTPLRSNCAILSSLVNAQSNAALRQTIGDIPMKLVRSITQSRGKRDHWENTQENMFCISALVDYAKAYESDTPNLDVAVSFNQQPMGQATFTSKADAPVTLTRPIQDGDAGLTANIDIEKQGQGRLYYTARIAYDLKEDNAHRINSGIEVRREYSIERDGKFVLLENPMQIQRGDLVKVNLFISVPTARHFVVVNDPIPGGLEPVNSDLATTSSVDAEKGDFQAADGSWFFNYADWSYYGRYFWSFYHKELRHDSARFYSDYLPAGNYALTYTAQAIASGDFSVMPTHAEEMYDPDVFGKSLPMRLEVTEQSNSQ